MTLADDRPPLNTAAVLATMGGKKRVTPPVLQEGRPPEDGTGHPTAALAGCAMPFLVPDTGSLRPGRRVYWPIELRENRLFIDTMMQPVIVFIRT